MFDVCLMRRREMPEHRARDGAGMYAAVRRGPAGLSLSHEGRGETPRRRQVDPFDAGVDAP
jgi:hypothetical protein